jgi:hypothetical protein
VRVLVLRACCVRPPAAAAAAASAAAAVVRADRGHLRVEGNGCCVLPLAQLARLLQQQLHQLVL